MTDQQMDARLRAAGERFRAEGTGSETSIGVDEIDFAGPVAGRRFRGQLIVAAAVVAALVVGLAIGLRGSTHPTPPSVDNAGLVGNVWLLSPGLNAGAALYISPSGALVADDECRLITAKATVTGNHLSVADMIERFKPCVDEHFGPGFYAKGARVLRGPATARIDSAGMTITRAGVGSLRFVLAQTPIPPPSPDIPTLTGTDWLAPNGKVLHIDPSTGQLSGGWCGGRAVVSGPSARFTDCAPTGRRTYVARITGTTLTLVDPHDRGVPDSLVFRWRPADPSIVDPASLTGRTWHLLTVNGMPASSGSLRIEDNTAVVEDGCTTYRRTVDVSDGTFTIAGAAPTHTCTDQAGTADSFVFTSPATWTVRAGKLIVYGGTSQTHALVYGPTSQPPPQSPAQLTGNTWRLTDTRIGPIDHHAIGDVTLAFPNSSTLSITRCYKSQADVVVSTSSVAVHGLHVTKALPCPSGPPGTQQQNDFIDHVLTGTVTWTTFGDRLTLAHGRRVALVFTRSRQLVGTSWVLTSTVPAGPGNTAPAFPAPPVIFAFSANAVSAGGTEATTVTYTQRTIEFHQPWADNLSIRRGPQLSVQSARVIFGSLLQGTVSYHVSGRSLILFNPRVGELNFTRRR